MTEPWAGTYFDTVYLRRWALGLPSDEVYRHVDFILGQFRAARGDLLLDVGCGQGRYSLAFASRGLRVTGLDASKSLLSEAGRLTRQAGVDVSWILGDMRALPLRRVYSFAALIDSLGFFDRDEANEAVIRELAAVLKPNGRMVLAVANGRRILNTFEATGREERNGRVVVVQRELDADRRIMLEQVTVEESGSRVAAERRQRLYASSELVGIGVRAGLTVCSVHGDLVGSAFDEDASATIVLICALTPAPSRTPAVR